MLSQARRLTFNRTIVELKRGSPQARPPQTSTFNRTIVELKQ